MNENNRFDDRSGSGFVGLAIISLCIVGVGSALGSLIAIAAKHDFVGAGVLAVASALSFGLMLNAFLRQ